MSELTLESLRAQGAQHHDPARFRYLEVLAERLPAQPPAVRELLARRLQAALADYASGVQASPSRPAVAAAVATRVVLPVLPLFDSPSDYVAVSALPDLAVGGWTLVAVAVVLCALATVVAAGQLRGGTVDRIREGTR